VGDAVGRGVGAVRRAERVVDVDVGERCELSRESGVVGLLARIEAHVLQHQHLTGHHALDGLLCLGSDGGVDEGDVPAEEPLQHTPDRPERVLRFRLTLGAAEVAHEDHLGVVVDQVADGRQRGADARVVGDGAVGERHVEVDAHEHALPVDVDVPDGHAIEHLFRSFR
jgi:hypothetical protein